MSTQPLERPLPYNADAERTVLGVVMLNNAMLSPASDHIRPDDFFLDSHRLIFATMLLMERDGTPIDLTTLSDALELRGELKAAGGPAYLSQLMDGRPTVANVEFYAKIVAEKSQLRRLVFLGEAVKDKSFGQEDKPEGVVEYVESTLTEIRERSENKDQAPVKMKQAVAESYEAFERVAAGKQAMIGDTTGYAFIDSETAGWIPEDLVVIGARPSMGKTALCLEFARRTARTGKGVMIFSLEMSRASLVMRLACMLGRVDSHKLRTGYCSTEDIQALRDAVIQLSELPIWIIDPSHMSSGQLVSRVRRYANRFDLRLVIVDYMQLLHAKAENRTQEVSLISRDLKQAAKALGKLSGGTLIATSQLSRTKNVEPELSDLRESGQIEQDADVVMFIWNKKSRAKIGQADPHVKWLGIKKQRNGPTRNLQMTYLPQWTAFEPASAEDLAEQEDGTYEQI